MHYININLVLNYCFSIHFHSTLLITIDIIVAIEILVYYIPGLHLHRLYTMFTILNRHTCIIIQKKKSYINNINIRLITN